MGIVARVGSVGTQRLGLPLAFVRADAADPSAAAHERALVRAAVQAAATRDALVCDAGFEIRQLQEAGATRYVVRAAKNVTGRRATVADYPGRGRPRERGELIRPLARTYRGRALAAQIGLVVTQTVWFACRRQNSWSIRCCPLAGAAPPAAAHSRFVWSLCAMPCCFPALQRRSVRDVPRHCAP